MIKNFHFKYLLKQTCRVFKAPNNGLFSASKIAEIERSKCVHDFSKYTTSKKRYTQTASDPNLFYKNKTIIVKKIKKILNKSV